MIVFGNIFINYFTMNIELKKIEENDMELLRKWRMQENVTKYMITDPKITKDEQIKWYNKIKDDKSRIDYVIMCDDIRIGYYGITCINKEDSSCEIGFYIGENEYRGRGIFNVVQNQIEDIIFNYLKLNKIIISVLENNPIIVAYKKNGFVEDKKFSKKIYKNNGEYNLLYLYKIKGV